jgi:hypothetical protein
MLSRALRTELGLLGRVASTMGAKAVVGEALRHDPNFSGWLRGGCRDFLRFFPHDTNEHSHHFDLAIVLVVGLFNARVNKLLTTA